MVSALLKPLSFERDQPGARMNAYQKTTLILSAIALPLLLLFMQGMNYREIGLVGVIGLAAAAALMYALRTTEPQPQCSDGCGP
jgi:hypothetical protein